MRNRFAVAMASLCLTATLLAAPRAADAAVFTFDAVPLFTSTTFDLTDDGVTATFSSPDGIFTVAPTFFSTLTGNVLLDADFVPRTLEILFSDPQNFFSLLFALNDPTGLATLSVDAFLGATPIAGISAGGAIPLGFAFTEGAISLFDLPAFNRLVITSTAVDFAIDNVTVRQTDVPEPAMLLLLGAGLAGLRFRRRMRG